MNNVIEFINNAAALILLEDILLNSQFWIIMDVLSNRTSIWTADSNKELLILLKVHEFISISKQL
jgi:hypothetical protein